MNTCGRMHRVGVVGAGAFGSALAWTFSQAGHDVVLWGRDPDQMALLQARRENCRYLPDVRFSEKLKATSALADLQDVSVLLMVVPAQTLAGFLTAYGAALPDCPLVLCAKGIESSSGLLQSQIVQNHGRAGDVAVLSGPGFAGEIASGKPTALSIACASPLVGRLLQRQLSSASLRLYLTQDVTGVQLGGALKNVYAIACGLAVGADLGESARAALMTRGFAEMSKLALKMGAKADTLTGLSGLGDLALTCTSRQSRNFAFGEALGRLGEFGQGKTVEGIATAQATIALAQQQEVDMPIARTVADVLGGDATIPEALTSLMARPLRQE